MANSLWSSEEAGIARKMLARGATDEEFRSTLGRTKSAAQTRIRYIDDGRVRDRAKARGKGRMTIAPMPARNRVAPAGAVADAQRRASAPRTITAFVCGDPAPGQSALDRLQGVSV